jgi:hypothetical protein
VWNGGNQKVRIIKALNREVEKQEIWKRKEKIFFKEIRDLNLGLLLSKIITRM